MSQRIKTPNLKSFCSGQAAVEYVLVTFVAVLIFGAIFTVLRQSLYKLWVCELAPRIEAPAGCAKNATSACWKQINTVDHSQNFPPPNCS